MRKLHIVSRQLLVTACWLAGILLLLVSCKRTEELQVEGLYGRWEITNAERNGKETSYLRNGYFIIQPGGSMTINITGEDENGKYVLDKNNLVMDGNRIFEIKSLQNDSLTIRYTANSNSQFLFYMKKDIRNVQ